MVTCIRSVPPKIRTSPIACIASSIWKNRTRRPSTCWCSCSCSSYRDQIRHFPQTKNPWPGFRLSCCVICIYCWATVRSIRHSTSHRLDWGLPSCSSCRWRFHFHTYGFVVFRRTSAVFNAFLATLPQTLDQNHLMGNYLLPAALQVLLYSPSSATVSSSSNESGPTLYTYSLWRLETHVRRNWLMSVEVIMYKYEYTQPPFSVQISNLIRIILNSLEAQFHRCKRIPATVVMDIQPMSRSRDMSQPSVGGDLDEKIEPTPPISPLFTAEGTSQGTTSKGKQSLFTQKSAPAFSRKYQDSSLDGDDTESELVAIPESDQSDSTLHNSSAPVSDFLFLYFFGCVWRSVCVNMCVSFAQLHWQYISASFEFFSIFVCVCRAHSMIHFILTKLCSHCKRKL